jgi:DNA-binding GntR family transcriptional regulator
MDAYSVEDKNALAELAMQLYDLEHVEELIFENVTTDIELHELIWSRCNHGLLQDTLRPLQVLTWFYVTNFTVGGSIDYPSTPTHQAMVEAIIEGKVNEATALLEMIISSRGATLLTKIEESS